VDSGGALTMTTEEAVKEAEDKLYSKLVNAVSARGAGEMPLHMNTQSDKIVWKSAFNNAVCAMMHAYGK